MKWEGNRESDNVEDLRGSGGGSGGGGLPMLGGRGIGIGGIVVALLASWAFGINPLTVLSALDGSAVQTAPGPAQRPAEHSRPQDAPAKFVSIVLADTEDVWTSLFKAGGKTYQAPTLTLFEGQSRTACGLGQAAMGPFYCPGDSKVYIDLSFYQTLRDRLGAPGDFAQAYVIAHEVGHHVQNQLGIMQKLQSLQGRVSRQEFNQASVRVELQADCFAGVWAHHAGNANLLDPGDVEEGLTAASAIGDDRIQKQTKGMVVPESFTHGSSAQRVRWFKRGMQTGRMQDCDTFNTRVL